MTEYYDYRLRFPVARLPDVITAIASLRAEARRIIRDLPDNMLGDPRDAQGNTVSDGSEVWRGCRGRPATSYTDPDTGIVTNVPAIGNVNNCYVHIRIHVPPARIPFDPADYGLVVVPQAVSEALLGVWA